MPVGTGAFVPSCLRRARGGVKDHRGVMQTVGDMDTRRRRALYRAGHRGTKELDLMLGGYAQARLDDMTMEQLDTFEDLLALPDPEIAGWLLDRAADLPEAGELRTLVDEIRVFHGLDGKH